MTPPVTLSNAVNSVFAIGTRPAEAARKAPDKVLTGAADFGRAQAIRIAAPLRVLAASGISGLNTSSADRRIEP